MPNIDIDKAESIVYWVVGTIFAIATATAAAVSLKKRGENIVDPTSVAQVANELMMKDKVGELRTELKGKMYDAIAEQDRDHKQDIAEIEKVLAKLADQANANSRNIAVLMDRESRRFEGEQNKDREAGHSPRRRT